MKMRVVLALMAVGVVLASAALAAEPDPGTPAGAQRIVRAAAEKGDRSEVRRFFHATTPTEEKVADALAEYAVAGAAAYKAAASKYGDDESRKTLFGVVPIQPKEADEAKIQWKIERNKATPVGTDKNNFAGPPLMKIDGVWKMPMSDIVSGRSEAEINQTVLVPLHKQSELMSACAKDTADGKYATAADLRKALLEQLQAMKRDIEQQATTQAAATKPSRK